MYFNVRVYGILINEKNELLVTDEFDYGFPHTKFPGGGLELGEGTRECLAREFMEECELQIEVLDHFYTTDFYQKSAFNDSQILSIYYRVKNIAPLNFKCSTKKFDFENEENGQLKFRWIPLKDLQAEDFTLPIDRKVAEMIIELSVNS
jgi:8-oxo-dGTP diphosphatase